MIGTLLVTSDFLYSQTGQRVLAGRVVDNRDEPLAGANVYVRGDAYNGTSTDVDGYFSLRLPDDRKIVIEASFIGMKQYSVNYDG
jgi:outer membrane receptor for ferrienterochelin and colicins